MCMPVVNLPLAIRHQYNTSEGIPIEALLLDEERVVLTSPDIWKGFHFDNLAAAYRFVSGEAGKAYADDASFFFSKSDLPSDVASMLLPYLEGNPVSFFYCELKALLLLVYHKRVKFDASIATDIPPLRSLEMYPHAYGLLTAKGDEEVAKLRKVICQPNKALSKRGSQLVVPSHAVACRPDSTAGRKEREKALNFACDDCTPFGVFVSAWFADESNWMPAVLHKGGSMLTMSLNEDVGSLRTRIKLQWANLPCQERQWVEEEWIRRSIVTRNTLPEMHQWYESSCLEASHDAKKVAFKRRAKDRLKQRLKLNAPQAEVDGWLAIIND